MSDPLSNIMVDAKRLYQEGHHQEAFAKYLEVAKQGDLAAQAFVGQMYLVGEGTDQNDEEALKWYTAAATRDYPPAQCGLGFFYYHKKNDVSKAVEWYRKAAERGHVVALWRLGRIYKKGIGVPADREKAYAYFEQAAKMGHIFSMRESAVFLIKGYRGWSKVITGFRLLTKCIFDGARITWKSGDDERLRN